MLLRPLTITDEVENTHIDHVQYRNSLPGWEMVGIEGVIAFYPYL